MTNLTPIILDTRKRIDNLKESKTIDALYEQSKQALRVVEKFEELWAGGWGQQEYDVYISPSNSNEYIEATVDYFYDQIKKKAKVDIKRVGEQIERLITPFKKLQRHVITELSIIKGNEGFVTEVELLEKIEGFKWSVDQTEYAKYRMPKQIIVDYSTNLNRGIPTPPHIAALGYIMNAGTKAQAKTNFIDLVLQLLRQVEIKIDKEPEMVGKAPEILIADILNNFHVFCSQLKNRHAGRETIFVEDEYDVQDLLNAILRLHFKDVRPEEYTPSYAGSATRVDFLLKEEQIVLEVKKTRQGLADKHIGDQLILDIARYRNHPNCKTLICFVYDPESRVRNPRGVEADLKKLSTEEMAVEVFIRP
jgi:hypothetical protein